MKRAAILSFSERGGALAGRIAALLEDEWEAECHAPRGNLRSMVEGLFDHVDALIFVGACGIAVRAIAPLVADKGSDPAVLVADERGLHVISLLSGHIGGANALTRRIAAGIGAEAVITTATDVNGRFSVDEWAARRGLWISDMGAAGRFSAEILRRNLPMRSDFPVLSALPDGLYAGDSGELGLSISCRTDTPFGKTLRLVPRVLHIGLGCKRGTTAEAIAAAVDGALNAARLCRQAVRCAASIDVKRGETGLLAYCGGQKIPVCFYSAEELRAVEGEFTESDFVCRTVGVGNVCERSAMRSAGKNARLLLRKTCAGGVTVAIAQEDWSVSFE